MKTAILFLVSLVGIFLSGCVVLPGPRVVGPVSASVSAPTVSMVGPSNNLVVNMLYGRSGLFVKNNYQKFVLVINTNNGQSVRLETGQSAQILTIGLTNGDEMSAQADFYTKDGVYVGYDDYTTRVYYRNGSPFVRRWEPNLREVR